MRLELLPVLFLVSAGVQAVFADDGAERMRKHMLAKESAARNAADACMRDPKCQAETRRQQQLAQQEAARVSAAEEKRKADAAALIDKQKADAATRAAQDENRVCNGDAGCMEFVKAYVAKNPGHGFANIERAWAAETTTRRTADYAKHIADQAKHVQECKPKNHDWRLQHPRYKREGAVINPLHAFGEVFMPRGVRESKEYKDASPAVVHPVSTIDDSAYAATPRPCQDVPEDQNDLTKDAFLKTHPK